MIDQQKIGCFLKQLRQEKEITQQQLAQQLNVSNRTVSRWETGINMPDLSILMELSEFYQVDIVEILNGERNDMDIKEETSLKTIIEYQKAEKENLKNKMIHISLIIIVIFIISIILQNMSGLGIFISESFQIILYFISGMLLGALVINCIYLISLWWNSRKHI